MRGSIYLEPGAKNAPSWYMIGQVVVINNSCDCQPPLDETKPGKLF